MKKFLAIIFIAVFLFDGCAPTFNKPQPDGVKPLTAFPKILQGKYLDSNQASIVTIGNTFIELVL